MSTTAQARRASGKFDAQFFGRTTRFEVAIPIRKANDAISIRHIQKLGIIAGRIKRDSEWFVQIAFRKYFSNVRFAGVLLIVQHFDLIGAALGNEDVSVRRSEKKSRIAKPAGVRI